MNSLTVWIGFMLIVLFVLFVLGFKVYRKLTLGICKSSAHMVGKVVIVTGGNTGIGFETAKNLAERGARVIIACRNTLKGEEAVKKIIKYTGNSNVVHRYLDLSIFRSVREFADEIYKTESRIDVLINNAGAAAIGNHITGDGNHVGMQVNYFGPFLLTNLLLPLLQSSALSRIVNLSSFLHKYSNIDFNNLNLQKYTSDFSVYANSKLCINLMTLELSRRLEGTGVTANVLHPGIAMTNIFRNLKSRILINILVTLFYHTIWEASQTVIYLCVAPEVSDVSGRYFYNCSEELPSKVARDPDIATKLWGETEKIVKYSIKLK